MKLNPLALPEAIASVALDTGDMHTCNDWCPCILKFARVRNDALGLEGDPIQLHKGMDETHEWVELSVDLGDRIVVSPRRDWRGVK